MSGSNPRKPETGDTLVSVRAFREPEPYRGGYIVPVPGAPNLTFTFEADTPTGVHTTQPLNLAERLNRVKADPVYDPFEPAAPNGRIGVLAGVSRGLVPQADDDSEVLDLHWFDEVCGRTATLPDGGDPPRFHLYLKQMVSGDGTPRTTLFLREPEPGAGLSLAFPAASGAAPSTRRALQIFLDHLDDKERASHELAALFLAGRRPSMDCFGWTMVERALSQAKDRAAQVGSSMGGAWLGIFLANYYRISAHFSAIADEAFITPIEPRYPLLDRYREATVIRYSQDRLYRVQTHVNESLCGPDEVLPGADDLALRHLPLIPLDREEHWAAIGFGARLDEDGGRRHASRIVIRYTPEKRAVR